MEPRIIEDLPFSKYLAQEDSDVPLFSKSVAKTIIDKCPRLAYYYHPKLGGNVIDRTPALIEGTIVHSLLLESGKDIAILDYDSWRTDNAKEDREIVESSGKIAVLQKDVEKHTKLVKSFQNQVTDVLPVFYDEDAEPMKESSAYYEYGNGVQCQSRFDWISPKYGLIIDIKSTTDSSPEKCEKDIVNFGYDVQEEMYLKAARDIYPGIDWKFLFIFIEKKEPFSVSVIETDDLSKEVGKQRAHIASEKWRVCLESNTWPGYGYNIVSVPTWHYKKYIN